MLNDAVPAIAADLIKDGSDASFMADVIEESRKQPVIVDFWATWCGPCRQLGPMLERAVQAAGGAVKMVKIDVDKNPRVAGQLGVQSIPTVYAFVDGQPADGFQGALPESQIKAFIDRLLGPPEASAIDELLAMAAESVAVQDFGGAAQAYAQALQLEPDNVKALAGMSRIYLGQGEVEQARQIAAMIPPESTEAEVVSLRAALDLAKVETGEASALEQRVRADPGDHQARFELAEALAAEGDLKAAAEHLLTIVGRDLDWNDQAARKQLLKIFEAAGPMSDVARNGRRRLSSLLFS